MKIQRFIAALGVVGLAFGGSAYAGQYDAESLGQALPMWMETLASINDHGDVAWTAWDGSSTSAEFFGDGTPHTLQSTAGESWAVSVTRRVADGDTQVVGIAGSEASSQRLTDRSALLWDVRWEDNTTPTSTIIDLGAATDKLDANQEGTVQQSAAYGVVEKSGSANRYYVGGFARDKVHKNVLPKPVIWDVDGANSNSPNIEVTVLDTLANTDTATGYVSSIARDGSNIWACGNSTDSGAYNQATCWDLSDGPGAASADGQLVHDLTSSSVFGANVISSMVHRVRYVPVGEDGALEPVAVGSALVGSGGNAQWKGFAYNLSSGDTWTDLNLTGENETMAYDVAALTYEGYDDDVSAKIVSHGLQIAGISSTADSANLGGLEGGPLGADASKMTGIERRALTSGITDEGQVCRIQDDSEDVGNYEQLLALSSDGTYRLAMSEGELVRLLAMPTDASLEVRNRDATKRERHFESRDPVQYFQVQATLNKPAEAAIVRFANAIGCGALDENDLGACEETHPAAFELLENENTLNVALNDIIVSSASLTQLRSQVKDGLLNIEDVHYAQIAQREGEDCRITPVYAAISEDVEIKDNPSEDFDGKEWTECSDGYVDTQTDYDHCGACETEALAPGTDNASTSLSLCLHGRCKDGSAILETSNVDEQRFQDGTCYIDGYCRIEGDTNDYTLRLAENAASNCGVANDKTVRNICSTCDRGPDGTGDDWTHQNSSCCNNGQYDLNHVFDQYDRDVHHPNASQCTTDQMGLDRNSGLSERAWTVDRSDYSGGSWTPYTFGARASWSNGSSCNGPVNYGAGGDSVRRIRATLFPNIDTSDWYGASYEWEYGTPGLLWTNEQASSRARVRVHTDHPTKDRKVRVQLCHYIKPNGTNTLHADAFIIHRGRSGTETPWVDAPLHSPAREQRTGAERCMESDDDGVVDLAFHAVEVGNNHFYGYFAINLIDDDLDDLGCEPVKYSLLYGNDRDSNKSWPGRGACKDCCDDTAW